jgi:catechol 2,3-dioxygenase-like lactoylglutathione lyase family enzyme
VDQLSCCTQRRPDVLAAHSVDRFVFTVPDLAVAHKFYEAFGLRIIQENARLDLYTFGNPHCWGSIFQDGSRKQLQFVRMGIFAQDADAFRERIHKAGASMDPHPLAAGLPVESGSMWVKNPDGMPMQLVVASKVSPSAPTQPTSRLPALSGRGAAPSRSQVARVRPRNLSHILMFSPDVPRMVAFCESMLGLRLSDRNADAIAFCHTPHGSDHHLVAFAKSNAVGLHHTSWDVGSFDEVGQGAEQMRQAGWGQGWGVGRHVLGSNYFNYVEDPWGSFCEYSAGIDFIPPDLDWPAADHPPEDSFYVWGPSVPENFVVNQEHPVAP